MLVAQAQAEQLTLVTIDKVISDFPDVRTWWARGALDPIRGRHG